MDDMAKIQEKLMRWGWLKKTGAQSTASNSGITPTTSSNQERWLKDCNKNKQPQIHEPVKNNRNTDFIKSILAMIPNRNEPFQPTKYQGMVDIAKVCGNLLHHGWLEESIGKPFSDPNLVDICGTMPTRQQMALDLANYCKKVESDTKPTSDILAILDLVTPQQLVFKPTESQGSAVKEELPENLHLKGWYNVMAGYVPPNDTTDDTRYLPPEIEIEGAKNTATTKNTVIDNQTIPKYSRLTTATDNTLVDDNGNFSDVRIQKTPLQRNKYGDKTIKKTKPHEVLINSSLQEGWTLVKSSRYQVALAKLPDQKSLCNLKFNLIDNDDDNRRHDKSEENNTLPDVEPGLFNNKYPKTTFKVIDKDKKRALKSRNKTEDKTSMKNKMHKTVVHTLLGEGWTMVNQTRDQVTLVKLPINKLSNADVSIGRLQENSMKRTQSSPESSSRDKRCDNRQGKRYTKYQSETTARCESQKEVKTYRPQHSNIDINTNLW